MPTPPVRTITLGIAEAHPLSSSVIARAKTVLAQAQQRFSAEGYEVQTVRLSTRPVFDDLAAYSPAALLRYTHELQHMLADAGLEFCSLGPALAARSDFPLTRLELIVDLLAASSALSMTVQLATLEHGMRAAAALPTAHIIELLARETAQGLGNFRFAAVACVSPGTPFFPAAYHAGPANISLGLQGAGLIVEALQEHSAELEFSSAPGAVTQWIGEILVQRVSPLVSLAQQFAQEHELFFGGVDLSPAPLGEDSIVPALELCAGAPLGAPGTLAAAVAITSALKGTLLPTCGYCGLMLPVLEDTLLGQRWEERRVNIHQLLLYSSVCGTGLDTIPLPGSISAEEIASLLLDVAMLAHRLQKPLSARLFPVVGREAGERTTFTSPYLTNTCI